MTFITNMNFEEWKTKLLKAANEREEEASFDKFMDLVEMLKGHEGIEVLRVLMKTFVNSPDYGSQECVNSVMSSFPDELVIQATLEELPRLENDKLYDWIECLMADTIRMDGCTLVNTINSMEKRYRDLFKKWVNTPEFINDFPQTVDILKQLKD